MATKSGNVYWNEIGGHTGIQIPDRCKITCPKCGQEIGKNVSLMIYRSELGTLCLGISCNTCGILRASPEVEVI